MRKKVNDVIGLDDERGLQQVFERPGQRDEW